MAKTISQRVLAETPDKPKRDIQPQRLARALAGKVSKRKRRGGKKTYDGTLDRNWSPSIIMPPKINNHTWTLKELDIYLLEDSPAANVMEDLVDISPEISKGLWDFLRMVNPGWEVKVYKPNSKTVNEQGQAFILDFLKTMKKRYGSFDTVINKMFIGAWLRGAFFAELVLNRAGTTPITIVTPDPATVRFRPKDDPDLGVEWELGQQTDQDGFVSVDYDTVRYIPIDPLPGQPYGRPVGSPAVFTCLFMLGLMYDLRRVIAQQGYPRMDIVIKVKDMFDGLPDDIQEEIQEDYDKYCQWVDSITNQVIDEYAALEPDDAYVHSDGIIVNKAAGVDSSSLSAVSGILTALERASVRALKTMPLIMGTDGGGSEGTANRQWEIHVAGLKVLQHLCEGLLEHLFGIALRTVGIQGDVEWRFSELRVAELLRDEQVRAAKIKNASDAYALGYFDHTQASIYAVGHAPATPKPRQEMLQDMQMAMAGLPVPTGDPIQATPKVPQASGTGGPVEAPSDTMTNLSVESGI